MYLNIVERTEPRITNPSLVYDSTWFTENFIENPTIYSDQQAFIGMHRVMYGVRIRAGFIGDLHLEIDLCIGNDYEALKDVLVAYQVKMHQNISKDLFIFHGLVATTEPKPIKNSQLFQEWFKELAETARL